MSLALFLYTFNSTSSKGLLLSSIGDNQAIIPLAIPVNAIIGISVVYKAT